jgi:hypothetical protein
LGGGNPGLRSPARRSPTIAARSDHPAAAPVGALGKSGLSFAPALIAPGVVIGVSIAEPCCGRRCSCAKKRRNWRRFPASALRS